ncbi:MAG: nitronate monooxygenase [Geminicoccaceae bacterium]|nr:nitronate monooxygenase [Geminicoccaceae bacterium]
MTATPLHTPLCDLLGCRYPILQAGMGGPARSGLVAAVAEAGAYGFLGMVRETPDLIRAEIDAVRRRTERPFGVNLIPSTTDPDLFAAELRACLERRVHSLCFFWDVVPDAVARAKAAGCRVLYQVGSVEDAVRAEDAGADIVVAQGFEAGGHVRGTVTSLVLVPQVCRAVAVPVAASGGFADGAGLAAALALGAAGVHCGTAFLATEESFAHDHHKRRVVEAGSADTVHTDLFAINWPPRSPVRVIEGATVRDSGRPLHGNRPDDFPREVIGHEGDRPIYRYSTDSPLRNMTGDLEAMPLFAGQVAGAIDGIRPAAEVVRAMAGDAEAILRRLGGGR